MATRRSHTQPRPVAASDGRARAAAPASFPPLAHPHPRPVPASDGRASAAAPSSFPPIAEYAFLSDCHTGALVAPDGAVGWLCVTRFDAASVFGTLLDREAGYF